MPTATATKAAAAAQQQQQQQGPMKIETDLKFMSSRALPFLLTLFLPFPLTLTHHPSLFLRVAQRVGQSKLKLANKCDQKNKNTRKS